MSIQDAYTHWSHNYDTDRNLTRDLDQIVTRQMLANYKAASILELGCGTGKNTVFLADMGQHVTALDFSEGMLAQGKAKVQHDNVTFSIADLTQPWPCPDQAFDLIVCNLVLEHIEDLSFIFSEARRVLVAGGQFFISELHPSKQYVGKKATFQQGDDVRFIDAFVHHISSFLDAAQAVGFTMRSLKEWWHDEDAPIPPRLVTFLFEK
ncbi:methyltransferase domain-containing protein [Phototrophicus methaneseepsis]|uniref:Methyltransferase domain-containing protein n=1 Tax=Phototrophicus methaneseepsis TaxID=2710758 RepID=A0A7S8EAE5_9CHLR|nr:class I SAM-dependent methyltransferase [Phototrophicus methaneseepsis]QPC83224.1 methyltransferase domain-containing protein [Phototrophicus methaneseepsis]